MSNWNANSNPLGGAIAGALGWTPLKLGSSLVAWWDVSDSNNRTLNGSDVSNLTDKSNNGYDLAQGTAAAQPALVSADQNGLDVMRFNGSASAENMVTGAISALDNTYEVGIWMIVETLSIPSDGFIFWVDWGSNTFWLRTDDPADDFDLIAGSGFSLNPAMGSTGGYHVFGCYLEEAGGTDNLYFYLDQNSQTGTGTGTLPGTSTHNQFRVGKHNSNPVYFDGHIGEIILTKGDVSAQAASIMDYLNNKWAVY